MGPIVLDASALVAFFAAEPAATEVRALLGGKPPPSIPASNLAEVVDQLMRIAKMSAGEARDLVNLLMAGGLEVESAWIGEARRAGALRAEHYDARDNPVSSADCFCLATAIKLEAAVATSDAALAATARRIGVEVIALPNSNGVRP